MSAMSEGNRRPDRREDLLAAAGAPVRGRRDPQDHHGGHRARGARRQGHPLPALRNKDAVIDALLEREGERFTRALERAAAGTRPPPDGSRRVPRRVRFFVDHPVLTKGRDEEPGILLPRITAGGGPLVRRGLALFTALIAEGSPRASCGPSIRPPPPRSSCG
jgi:hypothetical protein